MSPCPASRSSVPCSRRSAFSPVCPTPRALPLPLTPGPAGFSLWVGTLLSTPQQAPPLAPGPKPGSQQPLGQSALPAGCSYRISSLQCSFRAWALALFPNLTKHLPTPSPLALPHLWSGRLRNWAARAATTAAGTGTAFQAPGPGPELSLFRQRPSEPLWSSKATSPGSTALLPSGPAARLSLSCFLSHTMSWTPY